MSQRGFQQRLPLWRGLSSGVSTGLDEEKGLSPEDVTRWRGQRLAWIKDPIENLRKETGQPGRTAGTLSAAQRTHPIVASTKRMFNDLRQPAGGGRFQGWLIQSFLHEPLIHGPWWPPPCCVEMAFQLQPSHPPRKHQEVGQEG